MKTWSAKDMEEDRLRQIRMIYREVLKIGLGITMEDTRWPYYRVTTTFATMPHLAFNSWRLEPSIK